ncbi:PilN domain-containing protein [Candidatus Oleimmundimicrobium sp.]|uniref:PilN domain-containing protein n=1 Tax=Candidatus Oleimmundimicrobium sp. TaxID=3060597 RepID=UPI002716F340|nr:PilN domain-containing protein [Candidatus Oleimmundimicrobium sp.]MDO8886433.1 PilN domain-containing protein [Candidatus Oleimmundimicrobium sp.]
MSINLLPGEIIQKRKTEKRLVYLMIAGVILVVFMVFTSLGLNLKVSREDKKLTEIKDERQKINSEIGQYKIYEERHAELQKKQGILDSAMANEIAWDKFLNEISMVIPSDVCLESLSMSVDKITYTGYTFDFPSVAKWLIRLGEIKSLDNIWFTNAGKADLELKSESGITSIIYEIVRFDSTSKMIEEETNESASSENSSEIGAEEGVSE